jgi:predicted PurR-regulated permease PerM
MTPDHEGVAPKAARSAASTPGSVLAPDVEPSADATPAAPGAPQPDLGRTGEAVRRLSTRSTELTLIAVLALLYTLYFARDFFIPITFALLLNFLLSPLIRAMARVKIAPPIGAAAILLTLLILLSGGVYALSGPANRWASTAPEAISKAGDRIRAIIRPVQRATANVERAASTVTGPSGPSSAQVVVNSAPSVSSRVFGTTQHLIAGLLEVGILLYFLLAGGDLFLQKLIKVLPQMSDKRKAVEIARAVEAAVSAYLSTSLLVNLGEGVVVTLVLWLLGMPNAPLWGVMVAVLELLPFIGALAAVFILTIGALTTFDNVGHALLIPGSFLAINLLQANVVSPLLLGERLTLNPVAIFIGLAFFFWIWGVPGAFLAVPLLATLKIFCDHIVPLAAFGEFLGQRDDDERRSAIRSSE